MKTIFHCLLNVSVCFLLVCYFATTVQANTWLQQRWQFKDAQQALSKNHDLKSFKQMSMQLQDYPIAHYLRYFYLKSYLEKEDAQTIQAFLDQYQDSPITPLLRQQWLTWLANKQDWETFIAAYTPQKNTILRCHFLQAHLHTQGHLNGLLEEAKDLWRVGKSQPKICDPVFDYLYEKEIITNQLRWQRIRLAMQENNLGLTRFVAKGLSKADQLLVTRWHDMHKQPAVELKKFKHPDSSIAREIILHGLRQLVQKDIENAYEHWKSYQKRYAFTEKAKITLSRYIVLKSVKQNHPKSTIWLEEVNNKLADQQLNRIMLQIALTQQDWQTVIKLSQYLSTQEKQSQSQWQYWYARALEQTGKTEQAEKQFRKVSLNRDYYGFLAANRLGKPYSFQSQPLKINQKRRTQLLEKNVGLIRARELYFIGLAFLARAEWQAVLSTLTTEELKTAAILAHQWGWHDRAIATIAKAKYYDDLQIRFPLPFYNAVMSHAQAQNLELAWVYAIILQESAFQIDARSADKLGLMQLKPEIANEIVQRQQKKLKNNQELIVPDININLGTAYLRQILNQFNGNHLLATAAYNAGIPEVKRWIKKYRCFAPDIWVELIPSHQTRHYIRHVLSHIPIFEYQIIGHKQVKPMLLDVIPATGCSS